MTQTIVVRGRVVGEKTIEVDDPLPAGSKDVEVVLHVGSVRPGDPARLAEYVQSLPPGSRSKEDIDRQLEQDRGSWDM